MLPAIQQKITACQSMNAALKEILSCREKSLKLKIVGTNGMGAIWIADGKKIIAATAMSGFIGVRAVPYIFDLRSPSFLLELGEPPIDDQSLSLDIAKLVEKQDEVLATIRSAASLIEQVAPHGGHGILAHQSGSAALPEIEARPRSQVGKTDWSALLSDDTPTSIAKLRSVEIFRIDNGDVTVHEEARIIESQKKVKGTWQTEHIARRIINHARIPVRIIAAVTVLFSCALCGYAFHGNEEQRALQEERTSVAALTAEALDAESCSSQPTETYRSAAPVMQTAAPAADWSSRTASEEADRRIAEKLSPNKGTRTAVKKRPANSIAQAPGDKVCYTREQLKEIADKIRVADELSAAGKFNEAASVYAAAVGQYPKHLQLRVNAIRAFMRIRQRDAARSLCSEGMTAVSSESDRFILQNLLTNIS